MLGELRIEIFCNFGSKTMIININIPIQNEKNHETYMADGLTDKVSYALEALLGNKTNIIYLK